MKYIVILGDGMADWANENLSGKTPLEVADKPNIDTLASKSQIGLVRTIPDGMSPGSDVANLSVMGYDPKNYYTGRSPLEALSLGVILHQGDIAIRTNLVTLSDDENFANKKMLDYSAGEISTEEAKKLILSVQEEMGDEIYRFYPGFSYRHCLVVKGGSSQTIFTPPHDISGKCIKDFMPAGADSDKYIGFIKKSGEILKNHPVNIKRIKEGKNPATHIWFWGLGTKPELDSFKDKFGLRGVVISAVDLLKGIAKGTGMYVPQIEGATGTLDTNWKGKAEAALECFDRGYDYVYLHMEAPDECGHHGDTEGKIKAIEKVDWVVGQIIEGLEKRKIDFAMALLPDHATPVKVKTHTSEPVPYLIYKSTAEQKQFLKYNEKDAANGVFLNNGQEIIKQLLN